MKTIQCGDQAYSTVSLTSHSNIVFEAEHALGWKWNHKLTRIAQPLGSHLRLSSAIHVDIGFCDLSEPII